MTVKIHGTNTVANPAFTGVDTDTGLQCGTNELNLVTGGTARVKIASDGAVQLLSSTGIDFSGIQTNASGMSSETLDSYEEGTWTPTFWAGDDNINVAYADQSGLYTKIGNIVHINFRLFTSSRTAGTGALYVDGLPFTPTGDRCVLSISPAFQNWGSDNAPYGGFTSTNGKILLKKVDNGDARALRDTNIDASLISASGLIGSMSYQIS